MPSRSSRINAHIQSFNTGEVSAAALARTDQERLRLAAEVQENLMPHVLGKGVMRPGSRYLATTPSSNQVRLLPFVFSVSDRALLELSDSLLRVYVNDSLVTRASVTSSITNGTFAATDGWITTSRGGGLFSATDGEAIMSVPNVGGRISIHRSATTTSTGTEHALRIIVTRGSVTFRCGTQAGLDNYIGESTLGEGQHSLAFTPTDGTYWVWFNTNSETQIKIDSIAVESAGVMTLPTPWPTAALRGIRFDQSGDVIYCAHEDYQQRKIERRGARSWSLVKYKPSTVPFTIGPTAEVTLTPGATRGMTTLKASRSFFTSAHVGALFKLTHTGQFVRQSFSTDGGTGGGGYFSDTIALPAWAAGTTKPTFIHCATDTVAATGTRSREHSFEAPDYGFREISTQTGRDAAATATIDDTVPIWARWGFRSGGLTGGTWVLGIRTEHGTGYGICRVLEVTSATVAQVEVLTPFKGCPTDGGGTTNWQESEWSDVYGWPSGVCLFDGRLWWGGRDKIWGSVSDDYENFDETVEGDSGPILRNIATGAVNQVRWILPLIRMVIGTEGSEVVAKASSLDNPLTPTEFTLRDISTQGSSSVSPVKADGTGYFVQRSGKRVYALVYGGGGDDYGSTDLTRLNDEIGGTGIVEISVQRQPDTRIWCVREDGDVAVAIHEPDEEVQGWVRVLPAKTNQNAVATEGSVESVCVLPADNEDDVYIAVKRIINGTAVRHVEKFAKENSALGVAGNHFALDAYATEGSATTTMGGKLTHLNAEQVAAWGTSVTGGTTGPIFNALGTNTYTVTDGNITLPKSCTNVVVGLPYRWRYKSAKLAYGAQGATGLLQPKKVSSLGIIAENFMLDSVKYGRDFSNLVPLPRIKDGVAASTTSVMTVHDERAFPFTGNWDTDSRVCMQGDAPYPFTALGIVIGLELEEKA
jgi:hypothetical protein